MRRFASLIAMVFIASCSPDPEVQPDAGSAGSDASTPAVDASAPSTDAGPAEALASVLEPLRAQYELPALAASVVTTDGRLTVAATGVRRSGDDTVVTPDDRFHLGSCTKAMTATVVALLIEDGLLTWDTTLAVALPELASTMHADFRGVTIAQLLHNRGGIDDSAVDLTGFPDTATLMEQRRWVAARVLSGAPATAPGSAYAYSNIGYVIVGAALERAGGKPWEQLTEERLFTPLGMHSCGFGPPGTAGTGTPDEPWGHAGTTPQAPGPGADNPAAMGPAGTVHCSLPDWARFAAMHLAGARGLDTTLLPAAAFTRMHARWSADDPYALGWVEGADPDLGRVVLHDGSNTLWYAMIALFPAANGAVMIATNRGDAQAGQATGVALQTVANAFLGD